MHLSGFPIAGFATDDLVLDVQGIVIRFAGLANAQPAANGQNDETNHGQPDGDGQEEQAEQKAQREDSDTGQHQSQPGQRMGGRLVESLPWIIHMRVQTP